MNEITNIDYPSPVMQETLAACRQAAATLSTVLLLGESGTGKDYLARYIHDHSSRSEGPFLVINCCALPGELIESELFGYEAGAFTGARSAKKGLIEAATGGTLVLTEIGDSSLSFQAKLLTFLDTRNFIRVGGRTQIRANVRLIVATNRDLAQMVSDGSFRADLYYRLNVFAIVVPPLRDRKEDIPLLAEQFLSRLAAEMGLEFVPTIGPEALQILLGYEWPGNVRELRNALERALIYSGGRTTIDAESLAFLGGAGDALIGLPPDSFSATSIHLPASDRPQSQDSPSDRSDGRAILDNDQYFQRMIRELFLGKPTPTGAVALALGCSRKTVLDRINRSKLVSGASGRMKVGTKVKIIAEVQQWLRENPVA